MGKKHKVQVKNGYYKNNYDTLQRFISYYYQTNLTIRLNPKSILEIGIGNGTTLNYLRSNGYNIKSCDFDSNLKPDYCDDIRELSCEDETFDLVIACEVLEHIPWKDFNKAISELFRVSKKNVIISIPYFSMNFELAIIIPMINTIFRKSILNIFFRIPYFHPTKNLFEQHYWEIGRKGSLLGDVRRNLQKYFIIKEEIRPILNPKHYFFVLEKRTSVNDCSIDTGINKNC